MLNAAQNIAGGLEQGLEHGIWGGVRGALLGYMTLPVVVGCIVAGAVFATGAPLFGLGSVGLSVMAAGAITTAVTAVVGYPINKQVAKLGSVIGGVIGFTRTIDEPSQEQNQTIQLAPDQELVVVNKPSLSVAQANISAETTVQTDEAKLLGSRVTELVHEYSK